MQALMTSLKSIGLDKHRYRVFEDWVTICAISLRNQIYFDQQLEDEYLKIIKSYNKQDQQALTKCFAELVKLLEHKPADVLGQLYMDLGFGDVHKGQFFTPDPISILLAKCMIGNLDELLEKKPFVTLCEPACGAGGMILAFANEVIHQGYNPAEKLWVKATDLSRIAAMMCYIQLSLWNIPAQVIVGNSLSLELRELWYTPAHILYDWETKLKMQAKVDAMRNILNGDFEKSDTKPKQTQEVLFKKPKQVNESTANKPKRKVDVADSVQLGFDFG